MSKKILFTRPCHDLETKYLHCFSEKLIKEIKLIGEYHPINLEDGKVTKENFEKAIRKGNPRLVVLNGHGTKDSIFLSITFNYNQLRIRLQCSFTKYTGFTIE